jgi:hypothetical protein
MIDSLWEQRKEMQKKVMEYKKALPYLEKLHNIDNKNKVEKLKEMAEIAEQAK